ncbi:hypothetical protein IGB42_03885 [Andreprevotia sp. IGB-42]|uniref:hypothetical protein n=1 Tax=Andreprevotia sp. IGB-42 TaxID=2497473 RepID=UPI00135CA239|nr:hypothetical protein [Andreprevotia sp. IGB-42]KAF0811596.1 hypothetical protein IGB42_03885 [Andreprevotia sp. IGB-42]
MASQQANVQLLIIDPQNDFCDIAGAALPVPGASTDMKWLTTLVRDYGDALSAIHVTLDSHNPFDIAHPAWWRDQNGRNPTPFTVISVADVEEGLWKASDPALQAASLNYVQVLAQRGRYQLIIWPEHCLIGGWGHNVQQQLADELAAWSRRELKAVNYVVKGTNPLTEHYSAIQAEVPDADDPRTLPDPRWIAQLAQADTILIGGEALSHCVASTVRDLAEQLGEANVHKLILLTDCTSPVAGFEALGQIFIDEMVARGMRISNVVAYVK